MESNGQSKNDDLEKTLNQKKGIKRLEILAQLIEAHHRNNPEKTLVYCHEVKKSLKEGLSSNVMHKIWSNMGRAYLVQNELDSAEVYADSLKNWAEVNNSPEALAATQLLLGDISYKRDAYDQSLSLYEKSYTIYDSLKIETGLIRTLNGKGLVHLVDGNSEDALKCLSQALQISERLSDELLRSEILENIGTYYYYQGDYEEAIAYHTRSLLIGEKIDDRRVMGNSLFYIGRDYHVLSNYDKAQLFYDRSLKIREKLGEKVQIALVINNLGVLYAMRGDNDRALAYYTRTLELYEEIGNLRGMAGSLVNIGIHQEIIGNYEEALSHQARALSINEKIGDIRASILSLNNIGVLYEILGDYEQSLSYYDRVVQISEEIGDKSALANSLHNIGLIYETMGDYEDALSYQIRSIEIMEELGEKDGIAKALRSIGNYYRTVENYQEALSYYSRALTISEVISDKVGIAKTLYKIGSVYNILEVYDKAMDCHLRSQTLLEEIGNLDGIISSYLAVGQILFLLGEFDKALSQTNRALAMADSVGVLPQIRDIQKERSLIFEQMGQYDSALYSHRAFKVAHDSLFTSDSQSVIAELQQQYKTKEQKQKIELLEQDRQLKQLWLFGLVIGLIFLTVIAVLIYNRYRLKNRANQIIQTKSDQLEKSHAELKSLSEFKQGMTGMIAHDIKNPLNSIIGISERMEEKGSDKIVQASRMILQLVTNMLDVEKYEHNTPSIKVKKVLLSELITEAKLSVELLIHDKSIQLKADFEHDYQLEVDPDMMVRVFINLLSNAIKFAPSHTEISILASHQESTLKLSFMDQGKGIHQDDLPNVFKKFWQSDARHSGVASSTGLGLSFCKMAVMAHDGNIYAESESEKGSVFVIELPIKNPKELIGKKGPEEVRSQSLNQKNHESLKPYARRLKELKVHQVSSIMGILDEIEALNLNSKWVNEMKSAVIYSNKEEYENLLEMIK